MMKNKSEKKVGKIILLVVAILIVCNYLALIYVRDLMNPEFAGTFPERIWSMGTFLSVAAFAVYAIFKSFNNS